MADKWVKRIDVAMEEDGSQWLPLVEASESINLNPGTFRISEFLGKSQIAEVMAVLSQVAVVRCEHLFYERVFQYAGYSEHFRPVADGEIVPEYCVAFHFENNAMMWFEFREM